MRKTTRGILPAHPQKFIPTANKNHCAGTLAGWFCKGSGVDLSREVVNTLHTICADLREAGWLDSLLGPHELLEGRDLELIVPQVCALHPAYMQYRACVKGCALNCPYAIRACLDGPTLYMRQDPACVAQACLGHV